MKARLFIALLGFVFSLAVSEIYARFFLLSPVRCLVPHPFLNHTWRPNSTCESFNLRDQAGAPYSIRYNDEGWREDRSFAQSKAPGLYRIFFVGDSFTAGTCPQVASMPSIVGRELQARAAVQGRQIEVINTGTSSYSPAIYYVLLKQKILKYSPDLILINVDMTDTFDDFIYGKVADWSADGTIEAVPPESAFGSRYTRSEGGVRRKSWPERLLQWLAGFSHLAGVVHERVLARVAQSSRADPELPLLYDWCLPEWTTRTARDVAASMQLLRQTVQLAQAARAQVILSAVPHLDQLLGPPEKYTSLRPFDEVHKLADELHVPYFDSYQVLKEAADREGAQSLFITNDMHFNERGYAAWAAGYLKFFEQHPELLLVR